MAPYATYMLGVRLCRLQRLLWMRNRFFVKAVKRPGWPLQRARAGRTRFHLPDWHRCAAEGSRHYCRDLSDAEHPLRLLRHGIRGEPIGRGELCFISSKGKWIAETRLAR